jgi:two-component sensor histidine kinase
VSAAVGPYLSVGQERIVIGGEDVTVAPRVALTLAMVLHELTTNAVKYGALSTAAGRVDVAWRLESRPAQPAMLQLEWRESGGPPVVEPQRRGFGSRFIEGSVKAELQGTVAVRFDPAGLSCTLEVPHEVAVDVRDPE